MAATLLAVRLVLQWGEGLAGVLHLRDTPSPSGEREGLGARLNEPGAPFLPFSPAGPGRRLELVHRNAVAYVEHPGELPEIARLRALGAAAHPVEVELTTGELLHGELLAIAPPDRRRLSDLLNQGETFLPLVDAGRTFYVHRDAVARVRDRDGA
jgi:hypothetical protein